MADYYFERQKKVEAYKNKGSPEDDFPKGWPLRFESGKWYLGSAELPRDHYGYKGSDGLYYVLSEGDFEEKFNDREYKK